MNIIRHIEFEIKGDLTCLGTDMDDFSGDNLTEYNYAIEEYMSECRGSDFLNTFPIKIKKVWYEVENEEEDN